MCVCIDFRNEYINGTFLRNPCPSTIDQISPSGNTVYDLMFYASQSNNSWVIHLAPLNGDRDDSALDGEQREVASGEPHDVAQPKDLPQRVVHGVVDGGSGACKRRDKQWLQDVSVTVTITHLADIFRLLYCPFIYRVTHPVEPNLRLTSKQKIRFGLSRSGQAKRELLF